MDCKPFTQSEITNLQRLIDNSHNGPFTEEEIKDSDILYFSQFGDLQGIENEKMEVLQGDNSSNAISNMSSEDLNRALTVPSGSTGEGSSSSVKVKNEALDNYAIAKYKEIDGKSIRIFECGICGKEFGHQYTLIRHLPTHTDERNFHCDHCGKSFRQMSTLSQHKAIHSAERPYVCEVCDKNFNRVSTLISHKKTHTGLKPHRCHLCNKAFHQKGNLRNHIFTHTNERPYKCEICEKGFNQMSNLMCHKFKAHQYRMDAVQKYQCKICGEEFLKRVNLRQHEQLNHGSQSASSLCREFVNAIIVEPIQTEAMKQAMLTGDTPFALLRPLSGVPVLVRVLPAGTKQLLVPATAEDLKKFSHISIRPKVAENQDRNSQNTDSKGCVVQIKVPVVATVIQKVDTNGSSNPMTILSPDHKDVVRGGPLFDLNTDSFVYTSTFSCDLPPENTEISEDSLESSASANAVDQFSFVEKYDHMIGNIADAGIEFVAEEIIGGHIDGASEAEKILDANEGEYNFEIPQDARDDPACPPRNLKQELRPVAIGLSMPDVSDPTESSPHPLQMDIPDKIYIENNGEYIEL